MKKPTRRSVGDHATAKLLGGFGGRGRGLGFFKLGATGVGHEGGGTADFDVREITTALRAHGAFAFESRVHQSIETGLDAWAPSGGIAKLGCTLSLIHISEPTRRS